MKIGFSLGQCVRDIATGIVDIDDVTLVISGTNFTHVDGLKRAITQYMHRVNYLMGLDETHCQNIASVLYSTGRLHQPRNFGAWRQQTAPDAVWADLISTGGHHDPMVQEAWHTYRSMLGLTGHNVDTASVENDWRI